MIRPPAPVTPDRIGVAALFRLSGFNASSL